MACCSVSSAANSRHTGVRNPAHTLLRTRRTRVSLRSVGAQSTPVQRTDTEQLATELNALDRLLISVVRQVARTDFLWIPVANLARKEILSVAEKYDLSTEAYTEDLKRAGVEEVLTQVLDKNLQYPDYYLDKFHGYAEGNLCWKAAFEAKYAWMSVSQKDAERRADWDPTATIHEAAEEWGQNAVRIVQQFCEESGAAVPKSILDVGCSTGYSSRNLRQKFPETSITGVDASPYFVAVAETEEKMRGAEGSEKIQYKHAIFEDMEQPDDSVDMVYFQFMMHELPTAAQEANLAKAVQVVRPGGIVGFVDINPRSGALGRLPAAIKALRAATEPWLEEYESTDIEAMFERVGLRGTIRYDMDERHYGYFARVPQ